MGLDAVDTPHLRTVSVQRGLNVNFFPPSFSFLPSHTHTHIVHTHEWVCKRHGQHTGAAVVSQRACRAGLLYHCRPLQ